MTIFTFLIDDESDSKSCKDMLVSVYEVFEQNKKLEHGVYKVLSGVNDGYGNLSPGKTYYVQYFGSGLARLDDRGTYHGANARLWRDVSFFMTDEEYYSMDYQEAKLKFSNLMNQ